MYKIDDHTQSDTTVTLSSGAQTTSQRINLDPHRGATKCVNLMVRRADGSDGNSTNYARYYEDFAEIPAFRIISVGGHEIVPRIDNLLNRFSEWPIYNRGRAAPQILFHAFAATPSEKNDCDGSINFASILKPQVEIIWDSTYTSPATTYIVTYITEEHSMVQHSNGELLNTLTTN